MKSVYTLATSVLATLLFFNVSAQPNTYHAVRNGDWSAVAGPLFVWDVMGQPPAVCTGCTITINSGFTVRLNTSITLAGGSTLNIGSGGSNAAVLSIPSSGGTDWASSFNVLLLNDGSTPGNQVVLSNNISFVNAGSAGIYDGILTTSSTNQTTAVFVKQLGTTPNVFIGTSVFSSGPTPFGSALTGPVTLSSGGILPILMTEFDAVLDKSDVELTWTTALETNSDHFTIQRLNTTTTAWETIGTVAAQGNSDHSVQYSYMDQSPRAGVNEYRIESVDRDGKYAISEVKVVHLGILGFSVFPNPSTDYVNISFDNSATGTQSIRLVNQSGQLLLEKRVDNAAGTIVTLPVSNYPQGNYLIIVNGANGSRQVSKLFISRL